MSNFFSDFSPNLNNEPNDSVEYLFRSFLNKVDTAMPVRVTEVNATEVAPTGTVTVQPLVSQAMADGSPMPLAPIPDVPYFRYQGGGNAVIIDPHVGDIGFIVCCSRDISGVKRAKQMTPPSSLRMHSISDALYVGGLLNGAPTQWILFNDAGIKVFSPIKVEIEAPEIFCNTPLVTVAGQIVMTGEKGSGATMVGGLSNSGGQIVSNNITLETHVHGNVTPGGGTSGQPV